MALHSFGNERSELRLRHLCELGAMLGEFATAEQTVPAVFGAASRALSLRSAVTLLGTSLEPRAIVWRAPDLVGPPLAFAEERARISYGYLANLGRASHSSAGDEVKAVRALGRSSAVEAANGVGRANSFITLPLVVGRRPIFGAVQLEVDSQPDEADLTFASAVVHYLAIALEHHETMAAVHGVSGTRLEAAEEASRGLFARLTRAQRNQHVLTRMITDQAAANARLQDESRRALAARDGTLAEMAAHEASEAALNARLHEESRRALTAREETLAIVSHELRSPLGLIMLTASYLSELPPSADWFSVSRKRLEVVDRSIGKMVRMIDDLLDASSAGAGNLALRKGKHALGPIVVESFAFHQPLAATKEIRLLTDPPGDDVEIDCDRDRILQVLANLLGNAIKFTPRGGTVGLYTEPMGGDAWFAVTDTGPGIEADLLPHVFERHWRAKDVTSQGHGLGLYISEAIVRSHGGRIWVESEVNRGSTFFFTLPLARPSGDAMHSLLPQS